MKALLAIAGTALFFSFATAQEAEKSPFTGTWSTDWGLLVIKKKGGKFTGKYTGKFTGTIEGKIKEGKLEVVWKQTNSEWGSASFIVTDEGKKLKGTWGGKESSTNGGSWDGKRE